MWSIIWYQKSALQTNNRDFEFAVLSNSDRPKNTVFVVSQTMETLQKGSQAF